MVLSNVRKGSQGRIQSNLKKEDEIKQKEQRRLIEKDLESKESTSKTKKRNALDVFDDEYIAQEDINEI